MTTPLKAQWVCNKCSRIAEFASELAEPCRSCHETAWVSPTPIPMILFCPQCGKRHIDEGVFATKVHHTHACQTCGMVWRPAIVPTVGVRFLPGFKNDP